MTIIELISNWAAEVSRNHSALAFTNARHVIEDAVGCIIAGAGDTSAASVREGIRTFGEGKCTIVGSATTMGGPWAALANGTAAHALDYDDTFAPGVNHASAVLVPALFALAEETDASGGDVLDAYIVGLEAMYVIARGVMRSHYDSGWHTTSTIGTIGAAVACARLLKLDAVRIGHAMSLAVSMSGGMKIQLGTQAKPAHAGLAAQHAIQAARLAESGLKGHPKALEGNMGFLALCGGPNAVGWEDAIRDLGKTALAIETRGVAVKRFPCCASTHRALDVFFELRAEVPFEVGDVEAIRTFVGYGNAKNLMYPKPENELQARFSMQYCMAVALVKGAVGLGDFTPAAVHDQHVRKFLSLTSMTAYEPTEEQKNPDKIRPHRVEIQLKDGRILARERDLAKGSLKFPLSDAERRTKFEDCSARFIPRAQLDALYGQLLNLAQVRKISEITARMKYVAAADDGERFARSTVA